MGFAYIVEDSVPCFVCHMAEKIFFPYLTGFQNFQGTVCGSFGMFFQYHCPDSGQRTVDVMKSHGSHSIHIDFCVSHQLRKLFVGHHLTQYRERLSAVQEDVKILRDVRHWLNQVLPSEQYRQTAEPGKKPAIQQAVKGRAQRIREEQAEKRQQPRTEKKQDMEL